MSAGYVFITSTGAVIGKEATLSGLDGFGSAFEDMKVDVNAAGRSAIVTFTVVIVRPVQGPRSLQRARVVRLWKVGADGVWRAEFEQRTPILDGRQP
jgi:hypothetical protein